MKNNKPRKWETLYERLSKQGQNAELVLKAELETEYYEENKNSKEDSAKVSYKMSKKANKIIGNLPKVKNILELRNLLDTRHKAIQAELKRRKENKKLEEEMTKLNEEYETITFKMKERDLPEKERKQLEKQLETNRTKRDENNKKFLINNKEQSEIDFSEMDDNKLRKEALQLSTKVSMCNMTCNALMKGESWQTIEVQLGNWDNVKLKANKENTEKLNEIKDAKKEE